jgi:hypothetical protein
LFGGTGKLVLVLYGMALLYLSLFCLYIKRTLLL